MRKTRHLVFLLLVLSLVASACGARLSKEQVAAAKPIDQHRLGGARDGE